MNMTALAASPDRLQVLRHVDQLGAGSRSEQWSARSADGLWAYERQELPGTPWWVTYLPTGQVQVLGSLTAARRWTGSDTALSLLAAAAADALNAPTSTQTERAQATVALAVLAGEYALAMPETTCRCGGMLAEHNGRLAHVNTCRACYSPAQGLLAPCPELESHRTCTAPEARLCAHCTRPSSVDVICPRDRETCCGCCDR